MKGQYIKRRKENRREREQEGGIYRTEWQERERERVGEREKNREGER